MVIALLFYYHSLKYSVLYNHNFHTHTQYCDGSAAPEAYITAALDAGLASLGFSGHAPVPFDNGFSIRGQDDLRAYCSEIAFLREKYQGLINVFLALEADYIPGVTRDFSGFSEDCTLDYVIGSVHLVRNPEGELWFIDGPERGPWTTGLEMLFGGNIREGVGSYFRQISQMIETQHPDVLGHLDKIKMHNRGEYFSEDEAWYLAMVRESLLLARENNCIVEVNTRGLYKKRCNDFFPGTGILRQMSELNIPVCISTDAHRPEEVGLMLGDAAQALLAAGYREAFIFTESGWKGVPLD